jgi:hypothetical protein
MNFSVKPIQIFLLCPIPDDQKPITEYMETKSNWIGKLVIRGISNSIEKSFFWFFFLCSFLSFSFFLDLVQTFSSFFELF